jgi:RHS repeat-associated protein
MDDETGLINMNARIYDPYLGRFLSADPVLPDAYDMQQFNRYSYVTNNPLKYTDPTGNFGVTIRFDSGGGLGQGYWNTRGFFVQLWDAREAVQEFREDREEAESNGGLSIGLGCGLNCTSPDEGSEEEEPIVDFEVFSGCNFMSTSCENENPFLLRANSGGGYNGRGPTGKNSGEGFTLGVNIIGGNGDLSIAWYESQVFRLFLKTSDNTKDAYKEAAVDAGILYITNIPLVRGARAAKVALSATKGISNAVPSTLARVVPENQITRASGTLGRPGADDVFVTAADDIRGLNASQIAERLTIPNSPTGFRIIEFPTPRSGIASPVNRADPGFIGGGRTAGGAREFVIPNGPIPAGGGARVVK